MNKYQNKLSKNEILDPVTKLPYCRDCGYPHQQITEISKNGKYEQITPCLCPCEINKRRQYRLGKEKARAEAIDYQQRVATCVLSYEDFCGIQDYFLRLGKRYGLLKEFRENGIL